MKKTLSIILAAAMLLMCLMPITSFADVEDEPIPVTSDTTNWTTGTYTVSGTVDIGTRINVNGTVTLILNDGCTLNANRGISVNEGNSLTINANHGDGTLGILNATSNEDFVAGIGGINGCSSGEIIINDGNITATDGYKGAGIGGGNYGAGYVTINGGTIVATGGKDGAGIGGGNYGNGYVTINGGNISATGVDWAAGIGGGNHGDGHVTINGGEIIAKGDQWGAGIGGGYYSNGYVTINGGTITAIAGNDGCAGIGGGNNGGADILITGGTIVKAEAFGGGAGIGSGFSANEGQDVKITILGGSVNAIGSMWNNNPNDYGAGIGSGWKNENNCKILIDILYADSIDATGNQAIGNGDDSPNATVIVSDYMNKTAAECAASSVNVLPNTSGQKIERADTCTENGYAPYYPDGEGKLYKDAGHTQEITDRYNWFKEGGPGYIAPIGNHVDHDVDGECDVCHAAVNIAGIIGTIDGDTLKIRYKTGTEEQSYVFVAFYNERKLVSIEMKSLQDPDAQNGEYSLPSSADSYQLIMVNGLYAPMCSSASGAISQ